MDETSELSRKELDDELLDAIYAFDVGRLRLLLRQYSVDPNRRTGTLDGGMPLLHAALDAEWGRGVNDEAYVPLGDCMVALIDAGADPSATYLGHTVRDDLTTYRAYAVMRDRVEAALRRAHQLGAPATDSVVSPTLSVGCQSEVDANGFQRATTPRLGRRVALAGRPCLSAGPMACFAEHAHVPGILCLPVVSCS